VEGLLKIADDWLADPPRDAGADNVADVLSLSSALGNVMRGSEPDPMLIERMTGLLTAALALHVDIEAAAQQFSESVGGPDPVQDLATLQWVLINQDIGLPDEPGDYEAAQDFVDDLRNVTEVLTAPVLDHVKSHDERIEEELRKIRALIEKQPGRFATLTYGFVSAEASLALHSSGLLGTLGRLAIRLLIGLHIP